MDIINEHFSARDHARPHREKIYENVQPRVGRSMFPNPIRAISQEEMMKGAKRYSSKVAEQNVQKDKAAGDESKKASVKDPKVNDPKGPGGDPTKVQGSKAGVDQFHASMVRTDCEILFKRLVKKHSLDKFLAPPELTEFWQTFCGIVTRRGPKNEIPPPMDHVRDCVLTEILGRFHIVAKRKDMKTYQELWKEMINFTSDLLSETASRYNQEVNPFNKEEIDNLEIDFIDAMKGLPFMAPEEEATSSTSGVTSISEGPWLAGGFRRVFSEKLGPALESSDTAKDIDPYESSDLESLPHTSPKRGKGKGKGNGKHKA
ncbi:hypothetical protein F5X97DRAFT_342637 [Nemania serpens]|nr:hypothetical protein F5X97DRAFT_342637 [Nemania serpens]